MSIFKKRIVGKFFYTQCIYSMLLKLFRTIILIGITLFAARITRHTQRTVYSVLAFQISGYELVLETKQSVQWISNTAKKTLDETASLLQWLLQENAPGKSEKLNNDTQQQPIQQTLDNFRSKLVRTSWIVACVVGIIVRKMLFDIVFGLKTVIMRLNKFIIE